MLYKKGRKGNKKSKWHDKEKKKDKDVITLCYHCKKSEHLIADCPTMKIKASTSKKLYNKSALKVALDDQENKSEEEVDTANVCFMTQRDNIRYIPTPLKMQI